MSQMVTAAEGVWTHLLLVLREGDGDIEAARARGGEGKSRGCWRVETMAV